jgi:hypothetical protein
VETRRLRLEGATLPDLQARVLAEHGDAARIIAAEEVTVGGIRGFFAKRHIEVTVEVPLDVFVQVPGERRRAAHRRDELSTRLGIAALLDDADEAEALLHVAPTRQPHPGGTGPAVPPAGGPLAPAGHSEAVSTATPDFARLMDDLTFATSPARGAAAAVGAPADGAALGRAAADSGPLKLTPGAPRLLAGPGDLVLLIGLPADVLEVARRLSEEPDAPIVLGIDGVGDRRAALTARAGGVEQGRSVVVTCGLTATGPAGASDLADPVGDRSAAAALLGADQVWAVVDASRKPADTVRWVQSAGAAVPIDVVAVLGAESTATPGTVGELGLPIGWLSPESTGPHNSFAIG